MNRPLFGHLPPKLLPRYRDVMTVLEDLEVGDQLEIACQAVVSIFMMARIQAGKSQIDPADYGRLFDAAEQWLYQKFSALRTVRLDAGSDRDMRDSEGEDPRCEDQQPRWVRLRPSHGLPLYCCDGID